jgi:hypothetical protein
VLGAVNTPLQSKWPRRTTLVAEGIAGIVTVVVGTHPPPITLQPTEDRLWWKFKSE